jgi:hypothetical protein
MSRAVSERATGRAVWEACEVLAGCLRSSPHAPALSAVYDRDGERQRSGPGELLSRMMAGFGILRSRPLLLGLYLPRIPAVGPMPGFQAVLDEPGGEAFLRDALRMAGALLGIIEWLRSALPGYPDIPVPALGATSDRVAADGMLGAGHPWPPAIRVTLTGEDPPALVQAGIPDRDALRAALDALLAATLGCEQWLGFQAAAQALSGEDRSALLEHCAAVAESTSEERLHATAGAQMIRRAEFVRASAGDARSALAAGPEAYLAAFDRVDALLSNIAAVISDRTVYGAPVVIPDDADVSWTREEGGVRARIVTVEDAFVFLSPGRLAVLDAPPPVGGGMILHGTHMSIEPELGSRATLDAVVLEDSEGVFA